MSRGHETPFTIALDGAELLGIAHWVPDSTRPVVIIVVGGPQYRVGSHRQFVLAARSLAARGYPVVRFDYRGMGDSGGESRDFQDVDADIAAVVAYAAQHAPSSRGYVLLGLCDAAAAIMIYARRDSTARGLVLMNPWARTEQLEAQARMRHYYGQRLLQLTFWRKALRGELAIVSSLRDAVATWWKSRSARAGTPSGDFRDRMVSGVEQFKGRLLLLMSGNGLTAHAFGAGCAGAPRWSRAISALEFERADLPTADHTFSARSDLERANALIADWLDKLA
jgi:uncharacterized protein